MWVLDPRAPEYPGSAFDALLPTADAQLLVEAPAGPVALLSGLPADVPLAEPVVTVSPPDAGRTAVLAPTDDREQVLDRLREPSRLDGVLARLAATTAPLAWAGQVDDSVQALVTLTGDQLRAELWGSDPGALADRAREALAGSLPGSPGKRWSDLLADVEVRVDGDAAVVTARTTTLSPVLLRTLLDQAVGAGG